MDLTVDRIRFEIFHLVSMQRIRHGVCRDDLGRLGVNHVESRRKQCTERNPIGSCKLRENAGSPGSHTGNKSQLEIPIIFVVKYTRSNYSILEYHHKIIIVFYHYK